MHRYTLTSGVSSSKFLKKKLAIAIAANLLAAATSFADTTTVADDSEDTELSAVVVTGEKIARSEEKTLSSVEVVTADEIREHGDQNLQNIMARTPGIYTQPGNDNWGIRGVPVSGFDDQGAVTMNGAVSVFIDGAVQPHRLATLRPAHFWDMEQVEIFRGAQSTSQGRSSLAGAVVLKTKDPTFSPEAAVQGNVGNYGQQGASALANGALVEGKVAGRVTVDYQTEDGYIRNETLDADANPLRAVNARGKLLIQPSERSNLLLTIARNEVHQGSTDVNVDEGRPRYYSQSFNTKEKDEIEQDSATAKFDYSLSDSLILTSLTTGTWADYSSILDFNQESEPAEGRQEILRKHEQQLASQEFRLGYETERLTGVVGVYFGTHKNDFKDRIVGDAIGIELLEAEWETEIDGSTILAVNGETSIKNAAIFGEANWEAVDHWELIGGLRLDHEKNEVDIEYPVDALGIVSTPRAKEDDSFDVALPKVGVSHELSENQLVGLTYSRGYRSGGVSVAIRSSHEPYDPEFTDTYELAWRGAWLDKKLRTTANIYRTDWKDQQVLLRDSDGNRKVDNASESRMHGFELSADYQVTRSLQLLLGGAYSDTEYLDFVADGEDFSGLFTGQEFTFSPEYKISAGVIYAFSNGLQLGADVVYQDESVSSYITDDDGNVVDAYVNDSVTLVNLNADYLIGESITVSGYVKNLLDKDYITNNDEATVDVGAPRTAGVAARYDF